MPRQKHNDGRTSNEETPSLGQPQQDSQNNYTNVENARNPNPNHVVGYRRRVPLGLDAGLALSESFWKDDGHVSFEENYSDLCDQHCDAMTAR